MKITKVTKEYYEVDGEKIYFICKKCKGTGSYRIPVSSPIMAPYGKDDTTSVPCECKLRN